MTEFKREERYIVIKRKHLVNAAQERNLWEAIYGNGIHTVKCVVVESDWPEYETVWRMLQDRIEGKPSEIETLRQQVKELEYEAGYTKPVDPGDNAYPNPLDVAACLRNCPEDLLTEARFVLWQGKEIETLRQRAKEWSDRAMEFSGMASRYEEELAALKAGQGKPVAIVKWNTGGLVVHIVGDVKADDMLYTSAPTIPEGWQRVIEAAKFAIFCPDAGGYRDGRSVEDCYEELESAVNAYYGTDICAADLDWITEDELSAMLAAAPKPKETQTCFSAGDMADAQAKAFQAGRDNNRAAIDEAADKALLYAGKYANVVQAITDPENQPSQYGTVTLAYHRAAIGELVGALTDERDAWLDVGRGATESCDEWMMGFAAQRATAINAAIAKHVPTATPKDPVDLHTQGIYAVLDAEGVPVPETLATTGYSARSQLVREKNILWSKATEQGYRVVELAAIRGTIGT